MSIGIREKREPTTNLPPYLEPKQKGFFSRQKPSVLGRIAFWASVVGTLASFGGTMTLAMTTGAPSADSIMVTIVSLISAIVLGTRFRWAPVVSTLLGGFLLFLLYTEPYVIESLANPKGPNGGFGHFAGDIVAFACGMLMFGGSLGAAIENYRPGSQVAKRWLRPGLALIAGLVIGAMFIGALAQPPSDGTSYINGVPAVHMGAGGFLQPSVTISKGSKLVLVDDTTVTHNLFNGSWHNGTPQVAQEPGAPLVNNVQLSGGSTTIGPFSVAGTYHIFCTVHTGMNLTVIVQ